MVGDYYLEAYLGKLEQLVYHFHIGSGIFSKTSSFYFGPDIVLGRLASAWSLASLWCKLVFTYWNISKFRLDSCKSIVHASLYWNTRRLTYFLLEYQEAYQGAPC